MLPKRFNRVYCELISAAAVAAIALNAGDLHLSYFWRQPFLAVTLSVAAVLAELLPVKIPRRGEDEEITLSTSIVVAILLSGGLLPALIVGCGASLVQDLFSRKPLFRVRFNAAQTAVSMACALLVLHAFGVRVDDSLRHPFAGAELPVVLLSALTFFLVNTGLVGLAVASHLEMPIVRYFRTGLDFVVITAGVLLIMAPIVVAAAAYSVWMVPLMAAPILMIHNALRQGARSDHAAHHDPLTGLPNRMALAEAVQTIARDRDGAALLLMDLDRFKEVNDTLGHHHGDLLLKQVATRLRGVMREGEQFARLGGDEFAFLLRRCDAAGALVAAERIAEALRPAFQLQETVLDVQASVGIALYPAHGRDTDTLLQKADIAMYRAKGLKTGAFLYDEEHDHHSRGRLTLGAELRHAIENDGISVYYQPALDLASGEVRGVEALARWEHPRHGLLTPASFIDAAEETGLITPLTRRVLAVALEQAARWRELRMDIAVAVNISAAVLVEPGFVDHVRAALATAHVPASTLKLEVTESALITQPQASRVLLQELHALGAEIAIDDFGTGYSSLAYLADLPASVVKIDRSFVARMQTSQKDAIIVNSTIDLAHHLGMRATAEGVEEHELLELLRTLGCDGIQGYVISRPLPAAEMTGFLLGREPVAHQRSARPAAAGTGQIALG